MEKRIQNCVVLLVFFLIVFLNALIFTKNEVENTDEILISLDEETDVISEEKMIEMTIAQMNEEMVAIESITDKQEWFIAYREIVNKYSYILDPSETIYDYYTDEEIYIMQRVVETECYDQDFMSKANVASVLLNRIYSGEFGNTVEEVIVRPNQFVYGRKNITESTKSALEYAFEIEDTTNGALYFHSGEKRDKFNGASYIFQDSSGHCFYK